MSALDNASLVELGLLGVSSLDAEFIVIESRGELASWLRPGAKATVDSMALVGLEDELHALRDNPGTSLNLPDLTFGESVQQRFYTVVVVWDAPNACYVVLTTVVSAQDNYLVNATQLTRAKAFYDEQLSLERKHFRQIYENTPQLAVCFREDGVAVAASQELLQHYLDGELPASEQLPENPRHVLRALRESAIWQRVWRGERVHAEALAADNSAGESCDFEVSGIKAKQPSLGYFEAYFTLINVTARNRALEALRERGDELQSLSERLQVSNHRFEQFATVAAHDLLSPLRRISRLSQIIGDEFADSSSELLRTTLEELNKSAYQGRKLVNDVMELSRVAAMRGEFEPLVPSEVMATVQDEYRFDLEEIGASVEYSGVAATVDADETLLFQIYRNLVSNAIKYRDPTRALRIRHHTELDEHGLRLEVSDNGRGFDSEKYDVFGAFVRLVGKGDVQGTGIGLAIVKEAAGTLGWDVSAVAREGEGAAFVLHCGPPRAGG